MPSQTPTANSKAIYWTLGIFAVIIVVSLIIHLQKEKIEMYTENVCSLTIDTLQIITYLEEMNGFAPTPEEIANEIKRLEKICQETSPPCDSYGLSYYTYINQKLKTIYPCGPKQFQFCDNNAPFLMCEPRILQYPPNEEEQIIIDVYGGGNSADAQQKLNKKCKKDLSEEECTK